MKILPPLGVMTILASLLVPGTPPDGHPKGGLPGRDAIPAQHGVIRVPSGGSRLLGGVVRAVIQCASSQLLLGKVTLPLVKVWPAASWIVSPQFAAFNAS